MDRSIVFIFSIALLILQSTHGAELNSEATLNCNGKEFKCINSTHYQPCSLTERNGQQPLWTINGIVMPCAAGQLCDDESTKCCGSLARTAEPAAEPAAEPEAAPVAEPAAEPETAPAEQPMQIPVEVTVVEEMVMAEKPAAIEMPAEKIALKSLPLDAAPAPAEEKMSSSTEPAAAAMDMAMAPAAEKDEPAEVAKSAELAATPAPSNATAVVDMLKTEEAPKKKFSLKGLKKTGPMRLVKGFRASTWRPKISLDSQKDIADGLRKRIYERRNKYEKFVDTVLGKASPVDSKDKKGQKQPAPGQGYLGQASPGQGSSESVSGSSSGGSSSGGSSSQQDVASDSCDDDTCEDYDSCDSGDCDDYEDEDDCSSSSSSSSSSSGSCDDDDDYDEDDCDDEDELEPGDAEAIWEEEEVEGGIEIVEECPDDEDEDDDCSSDECDDEDDYEYEDGIEETVEVSATDDDCEDDSCDDSCSDDSCDSCDDSDEECKKKRKQQIQANKNKNKKKKTGSKKKTGTKKTSSSKKGSGKKSDSKKATQKKKVRYPPVQKIRKSFTRALQNLTEALVPAKARKGAIGNAASGIKNTVLNKVDDLFAIKDNGLFNKKKKPDNDDENTGCSIVEGWTCPRRGRYAHPIDCQKYVECSRTSPFSREFTNTVYECEDDEAYDPDIRSCTTDWSSCEALEQCLYNRQMIEDPSDDSSYFICIRNRSGFQESYTMYRRECTNDRVFDTDYQLCLDCDDSERLKKAKKRRQQIKKQKKCQKKKAQKKKGGQKKKSPAKKH